MEKSYGLVRCCPPGWFPLLEERSGSWCPKNLEFWTLISRNIALGGDENIFDDITRLQADDLDMQSIEKIRDERPDIVQEQTRWQLIVSRLKTLWGKPLSSHQHAPRVAKMWIRTKEVGEASFLVRCHGHDDLHNYLSVAN